MALIDAAGESKIKIVKVTRENMKNIVETLISNGSRSSLQEETFYQVWCTREKCVSILSILSLEIP